ncbi:MAG TPA: Ig-like domain-containing protein [Gemmatimonadales bacterium]|nr:Ig-like domain-containing protein [Gemmatimonadales bacterium]
MKRVVCGTVAILSIAVVGCTSREPTGPLTAATSSGGKTVVVSPSEATLEPGQSQQFSAQYFVNGKQKKALFDWSSSDEAVATVSSDGLVTAVGAGEATITATTSGTSGTARVTVPQLPPEVVAHIPLSAGGFGSAVSAPGVAWVTQPGAGLVSRIDIAAGAVTGSTGGGPFPVQVSANADGSRIYVPTFFSNAMVMSINTATLDGVDTVFATQFGEDAYGVANSPAGDTVFLGITNGPVFKIDMPGRTVLGTLNFPVAAGYHFEWSGDRTRLYASQRGFDGGRVFEIDPNSFTHLRTFETGGGAQAIQLSADSTRLFVAAQNGGVIVWDIASNSLVTTYATPGCSPYGMVRTSDNTRLWVSCVFEGQVLALDPTSGALLFTVSVGGTPRELSFDASSRSLIVPNEAGWVDIVR